MYSLLNIVINFLKKNKIFLLLLIIFFLRASEEKSPAVISHELQQVNDDKKKLNVTSKNQEFSAQKDVVISEKSLDNQSEQKKEAKEELLEKQAKSNQKLEKQKKNPSEVKGMELVANDEKPEGQKKSVERTVSISNEITEDMITYKKHWTGNYTPSTFVVTVNDQELKKNAPVTVAVKDDTIEIAYSFEFKILGRVHRSGGKKVTFRVPQEAEKLTSTFSWDIPSNLILDNAQMVSMQDIS